MTPFGASRIHSVMGFTDAIKFGFESGMGLFGVGLGMVAAFLALFIPTLLIYLLFSYLFQGKPDA